MKCRHCHFELRLPLVDLGHMPLSNAYLTSEMLRQPEKAYPLKVWVCDHCWLVQTEDFNNVDEVFTNDYAYFSSTSTTWLAHAKRFAIASIHRFALDQASFVVEIGSNDGYLLQNFVKSKIPCLGVEPTESTATVARSLGIEVVNSFFGQSLAMELIAKYSRANLIIANNVLAHVPDINDFMLGLKTILADDGVVSVEFPHLLNLLKFNQFDTIYHEHFSYLSLISVVKIAKEARLDVVEVEEIPTHGGSLRVLLKHAVNESRFSPSVRSVMEDEVSYGLNSLTTYQNFQEKCLSISIEFASLVKQAKSNGKSVATYGAAAKGNTLINYSGLSECDIDFAVDACKSKQGKYLPGSKIPIYDPSFMSEAMPDLVIVIPWNIKDEIVSEIEKYAKNNVEIITVIPEINRVYLDEL